MFSMNSMDTTWYLSSDTTATADNMTFTNATAVADGVTILEQSSALLAGLFNVTAANSSVGNGTHMSECDTNKPILIIITQVNCTVYVSASYCMYKCKCCTVCISVLYCMYQCKCCTLCISVSVVLMCKGKCCTVCVSVSVVLYVKV